MTHIPRAPRALAQRQALGRRLRAHRLALGLTNRDVAVHTGSSKGQVYAAESATTDVNTGTLIDLAAAVGLEVALVADYHLPLLDLTADELDALVHAADAWADVTAAEAIRDDQPDDTDPHLLAALDKLTTTEETTNA